MRNWSAVCTAWRSAPRSFGESMFSRESPTHRKARLAAWPGLHSATGCRTDRLPGPIATPANLGVPELVRPRRFLTELDARCNPSRRNLTGTLADAPAFHPSPTSFDRAVVATKPHCNQSTVSAQFAGLKVEDNSNLAKEEAHTNGRVSSRRRCPTPLSGSNSRTATW